MPERSQRLLLSPHVQIHSRYALIVYRIDINLDIVKHINSYRRIDFMAQLIMRLPSKREVPGSNPTIGKNFFIL